MTMESIARKTQRETVSMHTITVVTLVFLPATFLAVRPSRFLPSISFAFCFFFPRIFMAFMTTEQHVCS